MGEISGHNILIGEPEWNRPVGRTRRRWKDNNRMDLGWEDMDWFI
jgi:hypothetical protein